MSYRPFPPTPLRAALSSTLPENDQISTDLRPPEFTYVPKSHAQALALDKTIVEGMRGAGKSHWWAALNSQDHRDFLQEAFPEVRIERDILVSQGFGVGLDPSLAPSKDVLNSLRRTHNPRHIWQAVIAVHAQFQLPFPSNEPGWEAKVSWVAGHTEEYENLLFRAGDELSREGRKRLMLFDALDRLADDWSGIRPLARALFQLTLDTLASRGLRLKLFVRPDMLDDRELLAFPDSSKLLARKVALTWRRADLYALLFQCLANSPEHGAVFRQHCEREFGVTWQPEAASGRAKLPQELRVDESLQKDMFHALAGPTMAASQHARKRGFPYTWLPNHLVDSRDQVSPRSFFAALRSAAAAELPPDWPYALHYKAIQAGVQEASRIRVKEITQEDYPWVGRIMEPLRNQIKVPFPMQDVVEIWAKKGTLESLATSDRDTRRAGNPAYDAEVRLLPPHLDEGPSGVLRDLRDLGVIDQMTDDRIQMPDVYRIAFGFGRKGGVKPLK